MLDPHDADEVLARLEADAQIEAGMAFAGVVAEYLALARAGTGPVSTHRSPEALYARFDEPPPPDGRPLADVLERLRSDVLGDCNRLAHPMSMGHQVSAPLPAAVWMEALTAAANQSAAVFEMSPTGTAVEMSLVRWLCARVGFGSGSGGAFTSGGTEATFTGLLAARSASMPRVWEEGVGADPPVIVCGEHAHYSVSRAAGEMGLGSRHTLTVPSRDYRMDTDALRASLDERIASGRGVMAVVATAGSTATGSFDDLETIGRMCEERGIWLHVDAAHGGSALLSDAHRHRVRGLERARSLAWDAHKMLLLPLSAGVVLVREEAQLEAAFSQTAPYLFHAGPSGRVWDQGQRSFQCSRRVDAFKVWVALQRYGTRGLGALYDRLCACAVTLHGLLRERPDFQVMHEPEGNILCFRYRGDGRLGEAELDALNADLREAWNRSGAGWITTTVLGGRRVLRVTLMNPLTTEAHLRLLVEGLTSMGASLSADAGRGRGAR